MTSEPMGSGVAVFIDLTDDMLHEQWLSILARTVVPQGVRQVNFVSCEVVLCHCASRLMDHSTYGSSTTHKAEFPVQHLSRLFKRPPTSILAKMANLDGTRSNGGRHELEVASRLGDVELLQGVHIRILDMARRLGIDNEEFSDFQGLDGGERFELEGQYELNASDIESTLVAALDKWSRDRSDVPNETTERMLTSAVRVRQHRFAQPVLLNHQHRCGVCGVIGGRRRPRMLTASHIEPWRDSTKKDRLERRNG